MEYVYPFLMASFLIMYASPFLVNQNFLQMKIKIKVKYQFHFDIWPFALYNGKVNANFNALSVSIFSSDIQISPLYFCTSPLILAKPNPLLLPLLL